MSEQTYRNPLFGQRVDRYIPPELRQGLGAVLALGDMLNPVSAYREYIRDVGEEDYPSAATNLAGFVAPGVAGAIASRLGRSGIRAIEPYSDDASRALMEMLSPTGAPEVSRGAEGMSRREFLAGLGAAAATPALPVDEMLGGLGRVGARGGVGLSGRLGALAGLREKINELDEFLYEPRQLQNALNRALQEASWNPDILMTRETAEAKERFVRETEGRLDNFNRSYGPMFSERAVTQDMIIDGRRDLVSDIARNADAFADELGDLSDDELRGLADQIEDFMNNPTADLPVYNLVKGSEGEDIVGLFERNMGGFADRLEAEAARRGLEDVRLGGLREYLAEFSSDFGSRGVDGFGFVPDDFGVSPRMVGGVEDFGRGLGSVRMPAAEASQRTQTVGRPEGAKVKPVLGEAFDDWIDRIYAPENRGKGNVVQDENVVFRAMSPKEAEVGEEAGVFRDMTGQPLYVANDPERYIGGGAYGGKRQGRIYEFDVTGIPSRIRQGGVGIQERAIDEIPAGRVRRVWEWNPETKAHELIVDNTRLSSRPD